MLTPGTMLQNRYVIECDIGRGGMGVVYRGRHEMLGSQVAIKEMQFDQSADRDQAVRAFQREARLLASAGGHANLVRAVDCFEEAGRLYLVMDFVDGRDLAAEVNAAPGFLPLGQVLHWVDQICDVLEYLHALQPPIIYRDLKPSNVMVDAGNRVRLIDFGIARTFNVDSKVTTTGVVLSPGYGALEQYGVGSVDPRTDVYGLGATLYSLVTRRAPPTAVDMASGAATWTPPSATNPAVPPALDVLVADMMALRAVDRCASVAAARQRLRAIIGGVEPAGVTRRFCDDCGTPVAADGGCPQCQPSSGSVRTGPEPSLDSVRAASGAATSLDSVRAAGGAETSPDSRRSAGALGVGLQPSLESTPLESSASGGRASANETQRAASGFAGRLVRVVLVLLIVGGIAVAIYFARKDPNEGISASNIDAMPSTATPSVSPPRTKARRPLRAARPRAQRRMVRLTDPRRTGTPL